MSISERTGIIVAGYDPGYDPGYLRITEHQVVTELAAGRRPLVVDVTSVSAVPVDSYDRQTLRLFGLDYPGHDIRERLESLGAEYCVISEFEGNDSSQRLDADLEETLAIAVQSALISYFRTDQPNRRKRRVSHIAKGLESEGRRIYRAVSTMFAANGDVTKIIIPNGRYPSQKMATLAAERASVSTLHFEKGETPNGTYLQDYAPQNRLKSQGSVDAVLAGLSASEINEMADSWLARRAPSTDSSNEFAALWKDELPDSLNTQLNAGVGVVGFFTSSQDEFQFLGPEWQLHEWTDQFAAFDRVLSEFERAGFISYLRVHPNLATKAQDCFVRERDGIRQLANRHPNLTVIWHDDPANTYSLLEATDAVVVWDSTVGLEASARGIPVWTAATSRYGLVADVQERLSEQQVDELGVVPWTVDTHAAKRFIAYLVMRDQQMADKYTVWTPWDASHTPFGAKLAAALVSGGTPYRREALRSIIDIYRHRSLTSNWKHLRNR